MKPVLRIVFAFVLFTFTAPGFAQPNIDLKEAEGLYKLGEKALEQQDYMSAHQYFSNAANAAYTPAYYQLGNLYARGLGTQQNTSQALFWYSKSAEGGDTRSQLIMAKALTDDVTTTRDEKQALIWLKKAAENKNAEAQFYYGMAFFSGVLVEKNLDKAIEWVTLSAENNYAEAQHNLGLLYYEGVYVTRDIKQAVKWYTRAAENNFALSQFVLGVLYYEGLYVDQNYALALKWSEKAAEQNVPDAQYNAGIIYYMGYGLPKDPVKGIEWFEKSAAQNYKRAVDILASIESERTTLLDTAVYRGLKKTPVKEDLEGMKKQVINDCFYIDANIAVNVSMEDLMPFKDRIKLEPITKQNIQEMKKRLPKEPENFALRFNLGEAYLRQNQNTEAAKAFDEAESILKANLVKSPKDSTYYWLGMVYFKRDRFEESVASFLHFLEQNPGEQSAIFFAVIGMMRTGDSEKMKALSESLLSKNPADASGYIIHGMIHIFSKMGNMQAFAEEAKTKPLDELMGTGLIAGALQKDPDNYALRLTYNGFRQMGFLFKVAEYIRPDKEYIFTPEEQADYNSLKNFYTSSLQRTDLVSKYVLHKLLSSLYLLGREYDKSIEHAKEAINIKKTEPVSQYSNPAEVFDVLAATYLLKKDTLAAEKVVLDKIAQAKDEYASSSDYLALSKYQLHRQDFKGAEKNLKKSEELNPNDKNLWIGYTCLYIGTGNYVKARETLIKASTACEHEDICKTLEGMIEMGSGKYELAFKALKKALIAEKEANAPQKILGTYFK